MTDSEFGGSEVKQRFTFTRQGAVPAPEVTRDNIQDVTPDPAPTTTATNSLETIDFDFDLEIFNEDNLISIESNNQDFDLTKTNFVGTDAVLNVLQLPDEGYLSSGSPSGSDNIQEDNGNVGNILDFEMLPETEFILDTSILSNSEQVPTWTPNYVMNIDPVIDPELYQTILNGAGCGKIKKVNKRHAVRHRRGAARLEEEELKDEEHKWNVDRCRKYRAELKGKEQSAMTELEELEQENARLIMKEKRMRENLTRAKEVYLDLIVKGRVRFIK